MAREFDSYLARGGENVDSGVGGFGVVVDLGVFFEPGVCSESALPSELLTSERRYHVPIALNSNLTNPSKGPFSNTMTRSVLLPSTLTNP
jgi:hypothetical protein